MKRSVTIVAVLLTILSTNVSVTLADENEDSTLNLNTEEIKNKQEDYSSLTDVNGVKLFTNDLKIKLENVQSMENSIEIEFKEILFSTKFKENSVQTQDAKNNLFNQPTVFDKTLTVENSDITLVALFVVITLILGMIVFVLTKRKYISKENEKIEDNNYIYDQ